MIKQQRNVIFNIINKTAKKRYLIKQESTRNDKIYFLCKNLLTREFLFTSGSCKKNPLSGDYYNEAEAQKVTDVVDELLQTYSEQLQQTDVAVVASYNDQVIKSKYNVTTSSCSLSAVLIIAF